MLSLFLPSKPKGRPDMSARSGSVVDRSAATSSVSFQTAAPRLPNDVLRHIIDVSPKSIQRLFMPLNKHIYDLAAPLLYRKVLYDRDQDHTVLDSLQDRVRAKFKSLRPKVNRKQQLRDLVQILEIRPFTSPEHTDRYLSSHNKGAFRYTFQDDFPNVKVLRLVDGWSDSDHKRFFKDERNTARKVHFPAVFLHHGGGSLYKSIDRLRWRIGADLTVLVDLQNVTKVSWNCGQRLGGQNSTTLILPPPVPPTNKVGKRTFDLHQATSALANALSFLEEPIVLVGLERIDPEGIAGGNGRVIAQRVGRDGARSLPTLEESRFYTSVRKEYVRKGSSMTYLPKQFDDIGWISYEEDLVNHANERVLPRHTMEEWSIDYPAHFQYST